MKITPEAPLHLLHRATFVTLATHSTQLPGYPYATALPCVVDNAHRPLFCISALAEHTKNLLADPRASLSVIGTDTGAIQTSERMTMLGETERFEPAEDLVARYLRYQPEAEQYLQLDFMFFRFTPRRVRYIGGFGRMGWVEAAAWAELPLLKASEEVDLLKHAALADIRVLGVDFFGVDCEVDGVRVRQNFPAVSGRECLADALANALSALRQ